MNRLGRYLISAAAGLLPVATASGAFLPGTEHEGVYGRNFQRAQFQPVVPALNLAVEVVSAEFELPLLVTSPLGDKRLFIVDQPGRIWIIKDAETLATPFLDIRDLVTFRGEQGLLGMAFHPDYVENGRFFLNYTDRAGDTIVAEHGVSSDPNAASTEPGRTLLRIDDELRNHNGGWLGFGPDGYLYIANGDGGGGGDPFANGQNKNTLFAKILRIDVNGAEPYAIPPSNPFTGGGGAPEVWVYGVRNPWRIAFDGDNVYVADVGQHAWEEISVITTNSGGANLGWNLMEGAHCFRSSSCNQEGTTLPVVEYGHPDGCSITGGYVYRGLAIPELDGHYFYGDYCTGFVRSFRYADGIVVDHIDWSRQLGDVGNITSFGMDGAGELYITADDGRVFKIVRANAD